MLFFKCQWNVLCLFMFDFISISIFKIIFQSLGFTKQSKVTHLTTLVQPTTATFLPTTTSATISENTFQLRRGGGKKLSLWIHVMHSPSEWDSNHSNITYEAYNLSGKAIYQKANLEVKWGTAQNRGLELGRIWWLSLN